MLNGNVLFAGTVPEAGCVTAKCAAPAPLSITLGDPDKVRAEAMLELPITNILLIEVLLLSAYPKEVKSGQDIAVLPSGITSPFPVT